MDFSHPQLAPLPLARGSSSVIRGARPVDQCPRCPRLLASLVITAPRPVDQLVLLAHGRIPD